MWIFSQLLLWFYSSSSSSSSSSPPLDFCFKFTWVQVCLHRIQSVLCNIWNGLCAMKMMEKICNKPVATIMSTHEHLPTESHNNHIEIVHSWSTRALWLASLRTFTRAALQIFVCIFLSILIWIFSSSLLFASNFFMLSFAVFRITLTCSLCVTALETVAFLHFNVAYSVFLCASYMRLLTTDNVTCYCLA